MLYHYHQDLIGKEVQKEGKACYLMTMTMTVCFDANMCVRITFLVEHQLTSLAALILFLFANEFRRVYTNYMGYV